MTLPSYAMQDNAPQSASKVPYVTVIVTAYGRKQFVLNAVRSVIAQSIARSKYEILVVKNFRDEQLESELIELGVRLVYSDHKDEGPFLACAIEQARGDVVCFLDDDDEFEPSKLEIVLEAFRHKSNLAFYYNNQKFIDLVGKELADYSRPPTHKFRDGCVYITTPLNRAGAKYILDCQADFNMSSISVRRTRVAKELSLIKSLTMARDTAMLFISLVQPGSMIVIDSRKLTRYRVHSGSGSLNRTEGLTDDAIAERLVRFGTRLLAGYKKIQAFIRASDDVYLRRMASVRVSEQRIALATLSVRGARLMLISICFHLTKSSLAITGKPDRMTILGLLYVVSPRLAKSILLSRIRRS